MGKKQRPARPDTVYIYTLLFHSKVKFHISVKLQSSKIISCLFLTGTPSGISQFPSGGDTPAADVGNDFHPRCHFN